MNELGSEVEVAEEMLEAGVEAYFAGDLRFESAEEVVKRIYREMRTRDHK